MAITKSTAGRVAEVRVDWPEFPELPSVKPKEELALREWYRQVRQSVDRTLEKINRDLETKAATT